MSCSRPRKPWPPSTRVCCVMPSPLLAPSMCCASWAKRCRPTARSPYACRHEISSNIKERPRRVRIKHWLNHNSLKLYDKGSVLRGDVDPRSGGLQGVPTASKATPRGPKEWHGPRAAGLRPAAPGRSEPGGERAATWAAVDRSPPGTSTPLRCELVEPLLLPARRARALSPQPSRPTDRVRRRGRRGRPESAAARPAAVQGFRALADGLHAGPRVPRRHRRPTAGPRRHSAGRRGRVGIGGRRAASASAADGAAPAPSAKGGGVGPRRVRAA